MILIAESINIMSKTIGPAMRERNPKPIQELAKVEAKLTNPSFKAKAPANIVAKEEAKGKELAAKQEKLAASMAQIGEMLG